MEPPVKLRKLTVRLRMLAYVGTSPEEIRERILDNRIRECRVHLQRMPLTHLPSYPPVTHSELKKVVRRCCVRIPRINCAARSDISSTPTNPDEEFEQQSCQARM